MTHRNFEDEEITGVCYTLAGEGKLEQFIQRHNRLVRPEFQVDKTNAWAIHDSDEFDDDLYIYGEVSVEISQFHSLSGHTTEVTYYPEDFDEMESE